MTIGAQNAAAAAAIAPSAPTPDASLTLSSVAECNALSAGEEKEILLLGTIKCPALITDESSARAPIRVSAVIDRSGSMEGPKLELVKSTLQFVLKNLRPTDSFGIISYDDHIKEELALKTIAEGGIQRARDAVDAICSGGCTNLSGGLFAGLDQMAGKAIVPSNYSSLPTNVPSYPMPTHQLTLLLEVGNVHVEVPNVDASQKHEYTAYVRCSQPGVDFDKCVEYVKFTLHPSVENNVVEVRNAPFEVTRRGNATFNVNIELKLTDAAGGATHTFSHPLNFGAPDTHQLQVVEATDPNFVAPWMQAPISQTPGWGSSAMQYQQAPIVQQMQTAPWMQQVQVQHPFGFPQAPVPLPQPPQVQTAAAVLPTPVPRPPSPPAAAAAASGAASPQQQLPPPPPAHNPSSASRVNCVWLFTDGLANAGVTDPQEMQNQAADRLKDLTEPCTVYTFGFGNDHNATLLKGLADRGSGTYYYIENEETIAEAFADCLGGLVSVVAQDLSLKVEGLNGCSVVKALTAFPHEYGSNQCTIRVRDLCSEEQRDVVVTLKVSKLPAPALDELPVARWTLTYRNLLTERSEQVVTEQRLGRPERAEPHPAPLQLDRQRNRLACTEALTEARRLADAGKLPEARQVLTTTIERIQASPTRADPLCASLVEDLQRARNEMVDRAQYHSVGTKWMCQMESNHMQQRGHAVYSNVRQAQMKSAVSSPYPAQWT